MLVSHFICFFILIALDIYIIYNAVKKHPSTKGISFKETLDLTNLPIITFKTSKGNKYNMLIDTGCQQSCINAPSLQQEDIINMKGKSVSYTDAQGNEMDGGEKVTMTFLYNDYPYELDVNSMNLEGVVASFQEDGITLHGVLGSDFFDKYGYIIDFEKHKIYTK